MRRVTLPIRGLTSACCSALSLVAFVIEAFVGMTGSQIAGYSDMWLAMIIPIAAALIIILYWNFKARPKAMRLRACRKQLDF